MDATSRFLVAPFAMVLFACGGEAAVAPAAPTVHVCPVDTSWNGATCVASHVECPAGARWNGKVCAGEVAAAPAEKACETSAECEPRCERGEAASCSALGTIYKEGRGVVADRARAQALYRRACDAKDPEGCYQLTRAWTGDPAERIKVLEFACGHASAPACNDLGAAYAKGEGIATDAFRARDLYKKSCDQGFMMACSNLGSMHRRGEPGPKDLTLAVAFFTRSCDGGYASACASLGELVAKGEGTNRDLGRASTLYRKGCDGDDEVACNNLGVMFDRGEGAPQDDVHAKHLFEKACKLKSGMGCVNVGRMWRDGVKGDVNTADAAESLKAGCDLGEKAGCDELPGVVARAKRECDAKALDCTNYGYLVENGIGVPADLALAVELYRRSCNGGSASGCANLGGMVERGRGVKEDKKQALGHFKKACDKGSDRGCRKAEELRKAGF